MAGHDQLIDEHFERCWPWLEAAIRKMKQPYGKDYVLQELRERKAQFWTAPNAAITTRIETRLDGSKMLFGWLAGGNRGEIEQLRELAEFWAKHDEGCNLVRTVQRVGFMGKGKRLPGYRLVAVVMEKELL